MFTKISIALLTIFSTFPLNCMEPEQPIPKASKKKLIKQKSQAILRKLSSEKINEEPPTDNIFLEHPFIIAAYKAIESNDYTAMQCYLRNSQLDPNVTDQQGSSALQIFFKEKAYVGIDLLLADHRIHLNCEDLRKEYSDHKRILEYIDKGDEKIAALRNKIFARCNLDAVMYEQCKKLQYCYLNGSMTNEIITGVIEIIKNITERDAIKQNEQQKENEGNPALPELAGSLPDYATNEFIEQKIWFILSSMQHTNNI